VAVRDVACVTAWRDGPRVRRQDARLATTTAPPAGRRREICDIAGSCSAAILLGEASRPPTFLGSTFALSRAAADARGGHIDAYVER